jgi:hypothetical protein
MGFGIPIGIWFREDRVISRARCCSGRRRQRGYRHQVIERLINEHVGARQWHDLLWNLMMFELWHQRFVDARPERPARASRLVQHRASS